jgi:hypothetical protein
MPSGSLADDDTIESSRASSCAMRVSNSPDIGTAFALNAAQALSVYTSVPSGDWQRWIALVASTGAAAGTVDSNMPVMSVASSDLFMAKHARGEDARMIR